MSATDTTIHVVKRDGKLYRQWPDGTETPMVVPPARDMSEAEIVAAAQADADNPPLADRHGHWRELPRTFGIRRRLKLSRQEFASRFQIPIDTVNDWEDGRTAPDPAAATYLKLIAQDPDGVARMLAAPQAAE